MIILIFGWLRLALIVVAGSSLFYAAVVLYCGSMERERLENRWYDECHRGPKQMREAWVKQGLKAYHAKRRRRMLTAIYLVPLALCSFAFAYSYWGGL